MKHGASNHSAVITYCITAEAVSSQQPLFLHLRGPRAVSLRGGASGSCFSKGKRANVEAIFEMHSFDVPPEVWTRPTACDVPPGELDDTHQDFESFCLDPNKETRTHATHKHKHAYRHAQTLHIHGQGSYWSRCAAARLASHPMRQTVLHHKQVASTIACHQNLPRP